jgi:phosphoribosyl-ATP pyrophosphohydrolase
MAEPDTLSRLETTVAARRGADPDSSYVAKLHAKGLPKIAQKLGEEAVEAVIAGVKGDRTNLVHESADLLYHLLVLWADQGLAPVEVWAELERRRASSGVEEKASRKGGT